MPNSVLHDHATPPFRPAGRRPAPGNHPAREAERLVARYRPIAGGIARRLAGPGTDNDDLQQVALIALWEAACRFDPSRGAEFASYAARFISGRVKQYRRDKSRLVRWPRAVHDAFFAIDMADHDLTAELGRAPTAAELAARSGCTMEQVEAALWARSRPGHASIDGASTDDGACRDPEAPDDGRLGAVADRAQLRELLGCLGERERLVVGLRFYADLSQREIANMVGLSQMQICRLLKSSLAALRDAAERLSDGSADGRLADAAAS